MHPATLKDVSTRVGVSQPTASCVLNGCGRSPAATSLAFCSGTAVRSASQRGVVVGPTCAWMQRGAVGVRRVLRRHVRIELKHPPVCCWTSGTDIAAGPKPCRQKIRLSPH